VLIVAVVGCLFLVLRAGDVRLIAILSVILGGTLLHSIVVVHARYTTRQNAHHHACRFGMVSLASLTVAGFPQMIKLSRLRLQAIKASAISTDA